MYLFWTKPPRHSNLFSQTALLISWPKLWFLPVFIVILCKLCTSVMKLVYLIVTWKFCELMRPFSSLESITREQFGTTTFISKDVLVFCFISFIQGFESFLSLCILCVCVSAFVTYHIALIQNHFYQNVSQKGNSIEIQCISLWRMSILWFICLISIFVC